MVRQHKLILVTSVAALLLFTACAKLPQQQLDDARAAVEAARGEAGTYAAESLSTAEATLRQAEAEIQTQEGKWFKSYDAASQLLAQAKAEGEKAAQDAAAAKAKAREEAQAGLDAAQAALTAAEEAVANAPVTKDRKAEVEAMKADLMVLGDSLTEARNAFAAEDYAGASQRAAEVSKEAEAILADVQGAQS